MKIHENMYIIYYFTLHSNNTHIIYVYTIVYFQNTCAIMYFLYTERYIYIHRIITCIFTNTLVPQKKPVILPDLKDISTGALCQKMCSLKGYDSWRKHIFFGDSISFF